MEGVRVSSLDVAERTFRVAIVDDEPPARRLLREMLERHPDVEVVGEFSVGQEAVAALEALDVDVVFLDVQLPDIDGFEVVARLQADPAPAVIFVTAFDEFAIRAFEVHAVDYLLKPFDEDRLDRALGRVRDRHRDSRRRELAPVLQLLEQLESQTPRYLTRLPVKSGDRFVLLPVNEIRWAEAAGKHCRVHTAKDSPTVQDTLGHLHTLLPPTRFLRISRYALVNLDYVGEIQPWFHGDYMVVLRGGERIQSTRGYREPLERLLRRDPSFARRP